MSKPICAVVGVGPAMGRAIARAFAAQGLDLVLIARDKAKLEQYADELGRDGTKVHIEQMDTTDGTSVERTFARVREALGEPNVLVYNPAVLKKEAPSELEPQSLTDTLGVMLFGAMHCVRSVLPGMRKRATGTILFTGGGFAIDPSTTYSSHSLGKAALRNYAHSLFLELNEHGVHAATVTITRPVEDSGDHTADAVAQRYVELYKQQPSDWAWEIIK